MPLILLGVIESCKKDDLTISPVIKPSLDRTIVIETRTVKSNWTEIYINHSKVNYINFYDFNEAEFSTVYNGKVGDTLDIIVKDLTVITPNLEIVITDTLGNLLCNAFTHPNICIYPYAVLEHTYIIK